MFNKVKGGNYHEYHNAYSSHRRVVPGVRRRRRLLLEETVVGFCRGAKEMERVEEHRGKQLGKSKTRS
jgi:hypothetical protein